MNAFFKIMSAVMLMASMSSAIADQHDSDLIAQLLTEVTNLEEDMKRQQIQMSNSLTALDDRLSLQEAKTFIPGKLIESFSLTPDTPNGTASLGMRISKGFCVVTHIQGKFGDQTAIVGTFIRNNTWHYKYDRGAAKVWGGIKCFSYPVMG